MDRTVKPASHGLRALVWLSSGAVVAGLFMTAQCPPLRVMVVLLGSLTLIALATLRLTELSLMSRLYVVVYSLPFSATLGYLFSDSFACWSGCNLAPLSRNHLLMSQMLTLSTAGFCGLMTGLETVAYLCKSPSWNSATMTAPTVRRSLPLITFAVLLFGAVFLSWLHAPAKTIFAEVYGSAGAGAKFDVKLGLNSSYLLSYLIMAALFVDSEQETQGSRRFWIKRGLILACTAYVVIYLQLLRGDRECAGLVASLAVLYITGPAAANAVSSRWNVSSLQVRRLFVLSMPLLIGLMTFMVMGQARHSAKGVSQEDRDTGIPLVLLGCARNTWTAVALNNLAVATDYHYGTIEYLHGRTYGDYVLSIPPAVIVRPLGYLRPLDTAANPARWYNCLVTQGGMHPAVVPFRNFGVLGPLVIMSLWGGIIGFCELRSEKRTVASRMLLGCMVAGSMVWFWYGDMNLVRTLMIWFSLSLAYRWLATHRVEASQADPIQADPISDAKVILRGPHVRFGERPLQVHS